MSDLFWYNEQSQVIYPIWDLKSHRLLSFCINAVTARALTAADLDCVSGVMSATKPIVHDSTAKTAQFLDSTAGQLLEYIIYPARMMIIKKGTDGFSTDGLLERSRLLILKARALDNIVNQINRTRLKALPSEEGWQLSYQIRHQQAQVFRNLNGKIKDITEFFFLEQFAQVHGLSLEGAAHQIIFEFELISSALLQTEEILLKYTAAIPKVQSEEQLQELRREFTREFYLNSRI